MCFGVPIVSLMSSITATLTFSGVTGVEIVCMDGSVRLVIDNYHMPLFDVLL